MPELLSREYGLEKSYDPTGKQWIPAKVNSEQGLWHVVAVKDGKAFRPTSLPDYLQGKFTTADKVAEQIKKFLVAQWDANDEQVRKNSRKEVTSP